MTRARIESLLASFPKLIPAGSQHTSVETSEVRYVYQPLEDLYILLITNKASNILQDIDTLHLFARVVSDMCRTAEEREILRNAFELLGAFDEIVSLGYREQINLMQVRNVLEMESHEEKIQEIIARVSLPCFSFFFQTTYYIVRIKKRRRRKSSSVVQSNSRCSGANSSDAPLPVEEAVGGAASAAVWVVAVWAPTHPSPASRHRLLSPRARRLLLNLLYVLRRSRVRV